MFGFVFKAPSLQRSSAKHLEALEYHKMMEKPDTVIIDVRNAYETSIGRFQPPQGGAEVRFGMWDVRCGMWDWEGANLGLALICCELSFWTLK